MAYIGVDPNLGDITFQRFTGTGSATAFTLAQSVVSGEALLVTIGNVVQEPGVGKAYTAQGNTLTFSSAPANGDVITVRFFGRAVDQPTSYAMQLFKYVATNNQTAFTGADANGAILAFSGDDVDVYLNGVHLDSSDFTASNGNTITLGTGAATNDELVIRAYRAFTVTDTVSKASGGTFAGAVGFSGGITGDVAFDTNTLKVDSSNNRVGIGVTSPAAKLSLPAQASGDSGVARIAIESAVDDNDFTIAQYEDGTGTYTQIGQNVSLNSGGSTTVLDSNHKTASMFFDGRGNGSLMFNTGGTNANTERMRIDSSGNVGIGCANGDITSDGTASRTYVTIQGAGNRGRLNLGCTATNGADTATLGFTNGANTVASISSDSDSGSQTAGNISFATAGSVRATLDSSGNVGIGTSSPSNTLQVNGNGARIVNSAATDALHLFEFNGSNHASYSAYTASGNNNVKISTSETNFITQKMTIGATTTDGYLQVKGNNNADVLLTLFDTEGTGGTAVRFKVSGSTVGSISNNSSSTAYNTSSDYRLKEAVVNMTGAIDRVKALAPKRFNFIVDPDRTVDGFLAHEAQAVVPEAVTGTHNEVDDDGNAVMQGIDQSKLVPLLTGALQEAIAKIETLETRLAALESGS